MKYSKLLQRAKVVRKKAFPKLGGYLRKNDC